jgi:DNA-binding transcriptional LysR family regulator
MASSMLFKAARTNLDLDILRTLAVAHDRGGLAQAAEHLGRTPSAISLQIKRLQEDLGAPIFRKRGRRLVLTEAGEIALSYARRILGVNDELLDKVLGANVAGHIRVGCPQDFALLLPPVLSRFSSLYPRMQIELRVEGSTVLADAIKRSQLDLAIVIGHEERTEAEAMGYLDVVWIASPTFAPPRNQPLPLSALSSQCIFRRRAIEHLEAKKIPYRIAAVSPSLDGLWAALIGGLGVTARIALNLPEGLIWAGSLYGLPSLGQLPVTLQRTTHSEGVAIDRMAALLSQSLKLALFSKSKEKTPRHRRNTNNVLAVGAPAT